MSLGDQTILDPSALTATVPAWRSPARPSMPVVAPGLAPVGGDADVALLVAVVPLADGDDDVRVGLGEVHTGGHGPAGGDRRLGPVEVGVDEAADIADGGDERAAERREVDDRALLHAFGADPHGEFLDRQGDPLAGLVLADQLALRVPPRQLLGAPDGRAGAPHDAIGVVRVDREGVDHPPVLDRVCRALVLAVPNDSHGLPELSMSNRSWRSWPSA